MSNHIYRKKCKCCGKVYEGSMCEFKSKYFYWDKSKMRLNDVCRQCEKIHTKKQLK